MLCTWADKCIKDRSRYKGATVDLTCSLPVHVPGTTSRFPRKMTNRVFGLSPLSRDRCIDLEETALIDIIYAQLAGPSMRASRCAEQWSGRRWVPTSAVVKFPDAGWDWDALSSNVWAIGLGFIQETRHMLAWNWPRVSARPDVVAETIATYDRIPWHRATLRARGLHVPSGLCPDGNGANADADADVTSSDDPATDVDEDAEVGMAMGTGGRADGEEDDLQLVDSALVSLIHTAARSGNVDADLVRRNVHLPLDFGELSSCSELHDLAIDRPDLGWDWVRASIYATVDRFIDRPDLFDAQYMVVTTLGFDASGCRRLSRRMCATIAIQCACRRWKARRELSARKIQRAWKTATLDPDSAMCRQRLRRMSCAWGMRGSSAHDLIHSRPAGDECIDASTTVAHSDGDGGGDGDGDGDGEKRMDRRGSHHLAHTDTNRRVRIQSRFKHGPRHRAGARPAYSSVLGKRKRGGKLVVVNGRSCV